MTCRDNMAQQATPYDSCDEASQGMQTRSVSALPFSYSQLPRGDEPIAVTVKDLAGRSFG